MKSLFLSEAQKLKSIYIRNALCSLFKILEIKLNDYRGDLYPPHDLSSLFALHNSPRSFATNCKFSKILLSLNFHKRLDAKKSFVACQKYRTWAVIGATDSSFTPHLSCLKLSWKEGYEKVETFLRIVFADGYFTGRSSRFLFG